MNKLTAVELHDIILSAKMELLEAIVLFEWARDNDSIHGVDAENAAELSIVHTENALEILATANSKENDQKNDEVSEETSKEL